MGKRMNIGWEAQVLLIDSLPHCLIPPPTPSPPNHPFSCPLSSSSHQSPSTPAHLPNKICQFVHASLRTRINPASIQICDLITDMICQSLVYTTWLDQHLRHQRARQTIGVSFILQVNLSEPCFSMHSSALTVTLLLYVPDNQILPTGFRGGLEMVKVHTSEQLVSNWRQPRLHGRELLSSEGFYGARANISKIYEW